MELSQLHPQFDLKTGASLQIIRGSSPLAQPKSHSRNTKVVLAKFPAKDLSGASTTSSAKDKTLLETLEQSNTVTHETSLQANHDANPHSVQTSYVASRIDDLSHVKEVAISKQPFEVPKSTQAVVNKEDKPFIASALFTLDSESSRTLEEEICLDGSSGRERAKPVTSSGKAIIRRDQSRESSTEESPGQRNSGRISDVSDDDDDDISESETKLFRISAAPKQLNRQGALSPNSNDLPRQVDRRPKPVKSANQRAQSKSIRWAPDHQLVVETRAKTQYTYSESAIRWKRRKDIILACLRRERQEDY